MIHEWLSRLKKDPILTLIIPKLQTVMMEGITDPGAAQAKWRKWLVVLQPDFFVLEGIGLAQFMCQIPGQWVNFTPFLYIFDDNRQLCFLTQKWLQPGIDTDHPG